MPIPLVASLIMQGLGKNQQMTQANASGEATTQSGMRNSVLQKREMRQNAANEIKPSGGTGLPGMDVMSPATQRQMQIFNNVMSKYRPQSQGGV